jgi:hypothetical protein
MNFNRRSANNLPGEYEIGRAHFQTIKNSSNEMEIFSQQKQQPPFCRPQWMLIFSFKEKQSIYRNEKLNWKLKIENFSWWRKASFRKWRLKFRAEEWNIIGKRTVVFLVFKGGRKMMILLSIHAINFKLPSFLLLYEDIWTMKKGRV